jgi:FtsH-binding integral membrane protein
VKAWVAAVLDFVCVLAFVAVGIRTHSEADSLLRVAAPFLAALAIGWVVALPLRPPESLRAGVVIWLMTLVGGMLLRRTFGDGTAAAFIVVATTFLGLSLLGWRGIAAVVMRRRAEA